MFFSSQWLRTFLPRLPKPERLLEELTMHSVEVEGIVPGGVELGNVVVGEVLEIRKHPNADTLNIGRFDVGEAAPRQIVFGGLAELHVGDKIPVALAPTVLPGKLKIKERELRGELSQGMCCLNSELGILDRREVVHRFGLDVLPGTPIVGVLPLADTIIDIDNKSMTHRSDLFSHLGMAREIAAVFDLPFREPVLPTLPRTRRRVPLRVASQADCPRYLAIELEVEVGQAPDEIAHPLLSCGGRTINSVVDITNFVMLEYGQPMHAFDADRLQGGLHVRRAKRGESLVLLDGEARQLTTDQLVIADSQGPVALAGVMGGADSGVTAVTRRIFLEVATFEPLLVRRSAQLAGIRTESVLRFEKGLPIALVESAAARAVQLLEKFANARVVAVTDHFPKRQPVRAVTLKRRALERVTGRAFTSADVRRPLLRLGCRVVPGGSGQSQQFRVTPPWWRRDLVIGEDLIEEIVRLHGVNQMPEQPLTGLLRSGSEDPTWRLSEQVRDRLAGFGLTEVMNYSFYGADLLHRAGLAAAGHVEIANPLSDDLTYLRRSLLPRLLETVVRNQSARPEFGLFEIGHVFTPDQETWQLALAQLGGAEPVRLVRGQVEALLKGFQITPQVTLTNKPSAAGLSDAWFAGGQALEWRVDGQALGWLGEVSPAVQAAFGIDQPIAVAVLALEGLTGFATAAPTVVLPSSFPAVPIDLSFFVPATVAWADLEHLIRDEGGSLLKTLELFDRYAGRGVPDGFVSLAFHLVVQAPDRTLTMTEVEDWRDKLVKKMAVEFAARLRDS